MYTVHKSIEQEYMGGHEINPYVNQYPGFRWAMHDFFVQFKELFQRRRLYNAVISTSVVNLAQQLCGGKYIMSSLVNLADSVQSTSWPFIPGSCSTGQVPPTKCPWHTVSGLVSCQDCPSLTIC
jgi:hypothetical protein